MTEERKARLVGVLSVRGNATTSKAYPSTHPAPFASPIAPLPSPAQDTPTLASPQVTPTPASPHPVPDPTPPHTAPTPISPAPITAIPLATLRASPLPTPLVLIASDEDEDSVDDPVLKRRRTATIITSHSSSDRRPASLRDNPPSASSPPRYLALEEGAETIPEPTPAPAPELPRVIQCILRGYLQEAPRNLADEMLPEDMTLSLGGLLARANSSSHQAEVRAKEQQALADELDTMKEQMARQAQRFFIQEAALTEEMSVLRKAELEANKRLHDGGQKYTSLLAKVLPLRVEIAELKVAAAANQVKMTNLEECSVTWEVHLGKVEAELAEKDETPVKVKAELAE